MTQPKTLKDFVKKQYDELIKRMPHDDATFAANMNGWIDYIKTNKNKLKQQSRIADACKMSRELGETLSQIEPENWHKAACAILDVIYYWQNNLQLGDIPDAAYDDIPQLNWLGKILLEEQFIRKIEECDSALSYALTFKGLVLRSMLATLDNNTPDTDVLTKLLSMCTSKQ
jgi:tRNA splicing ligase